MRTIFCELYANTCSDVSDNSDNETLDSDSDVPTQLRDRSWRTVLSLLDT
jgi:hypothetical protein